MAPDLQGNWTNAPWPVRTQGTTFAVDVPATNHTLFFRLRLDNTLASDLPDDNFVDSNGDGIDGDAAAAIFVSANGNDAFPGTRTQPMATLNAAIQRADAAGKAVYVAAGTYTSGRIQLTNSVSIYGGYNATDWSRSADSTTLVSINDALAVSISGGHDIVLDRLTIRGANATGDGNSAYGIFAINSTNLVIRRTLIQSGAGASGIDGQSEGPGLPGGVGGRGNPGCENSGALFCDKCDQPAGGIRGASPCQKPGGIGGLPGMGGLGGGAGSQGSGGAPGGAGAPGESAAGEAGSPGANGNPGPNGAVGGPGNFLASGFIPTSGNDGGGGTSGEGGGGGGGGGGGTTDCDSYGSSGGGGGGGACGGAGGRRGTSGGGSFGIYVWNASVRVEFCTILRAAGGNGGAGGAGGDGGQGGDGGLGGPYGGSSEQDDGGNGAAGGKGGDGGRGGHGSGGSGGPSIGIYRSPGSNLSASANTFNSVPAAIGGVSLGNAGPVGISTDLYP
ncbi:MAG TPA: hypothetical protein VM680_05690 [Verrucomicrobiae bacterium]|nr:hypothetical protein [Verrucomicrobiae bacterium]